MMYDLITKKKGDHTHSHKNENEYIVFFIAIF